MTKAVNILNKRYMVSKATLRATAASIILLLALPAAAWAQGTVRFTPTSPTSGTEASAGTETIGIYLDSYSVDITVEFNISGTSTAETADRAFTSGTFVFTAADSQYFTFQVLDDLTDEENETLIFTMTVLAGGASAGGSLTYTIIDDDDPPTIAFATATASGNEGAGGFLSQPSLSR